jgi:hypothetical protein
LHEIIAPTFENGPDLPWTPLDEIDCVLVAHQDCRDFTGRYDDISGLEINTIRENRQTNVNLSLINAIAAKHPNLFPPSPSVDVLGSKLHVLNWLEDATINRPGTFGVPVGVSPSSKRDKLEYPTDSVAPQLDNANQAITITKYANENHPPGGETSEQNIKQLNVVFSLTSITYNQLENFIEHIAETLTVSSKSAIPNEVDTPKSKYCDTPGSCGGVKLDTAGLLRILDPYSKANRSSSTLTNESYTPGSLTTRSSSSRDSEPVPSGHEKLQGKVLKTKWIVPPTASLEVSRFQNVTPSLVFEEATGVPLPLSSPESVEEGRPAGSYVLLQPLPLHLEQPHRISSSERKAQPVGGVRPSRFSCSMVNADLVPNSSTHEGQATTPQKSLFRENYTNPPTAQAEGEPITQISLARGVEIWHDESRIEYRLGSGPGSSSIVSSKPEDPFVDKNTSMNNGHRTVSGFITRLLRASSFGALNATSQTSHTGQMDFSHPLFNTAPSFPQNRPAAVANDGTYNHDLRLIREVPRTPEFSCAPNDPNSPITLPSVIPPHTSGFKNQVEPTSPCEQILLRRRKRNMTQQKGKSPELNDTGGRNDGEASSSQLPPEIIPINNGRGMFLMHQHEYTVEQDMGPSHAGPAGNPNFTVLARPSGALNPQDAQHRAVDPFAVDPQLWGNFSDYEPGPVNRQPRDETAFGLSAFAAPPPMFDRIQRPRRPIPQALSAELFGVSGNVQAPFNNFSLREIQYSLNNPSAVGNALPLNQPQPTVYQSRFFPQATACPSSTSSTSDPQELKPHHLGVVNPYYDRKPGLKPPPGLIHPSLLPTPPQSNLPTGKPPTPEEHRYNPINMPAWSQAHHAARRVENTQGLPEPNVFATGPRISGPTRDRVSTLFGHAPASRESFTVQSEHYINTLTTQLQNMREELAEYKETCERLSRDIQREMTAKFLAQNQVYQCQNQVNYFQVQREKDVREIQALREQLREERERADI